MKSKIASLLCGSLLFVASNAFASPLFSDNFDAQHGGTGVLNIENNGGLTGWTVTPSVDLIGNGLFDFYPGNGLYLDLDGSSNENGAITSVAAFGAGTYTLTFDLGVNGNSPQPGDNQVTVSLADWSVVIPTLAPSALNFYTYTFTTTTVGNLAFTQGGAADNQGSILDNVAVNAATTPEPASMLLLGSSLVAGLVRRKKTA